MNSDRDQPDPDDAPLLPVEWFADAHVYHGDRLVRRGRGELPIPPIGPGSEDPS